MPAFRIAVIGGDGIGPEVIDQAIRVADAALRHESGAALEWNRLPWSGDNYLKVGYMLPPDGWDVLKKHDAVFLGAIGITESDLRPSGRARFGDHIVAVVSHGGYIAQNIEVTVIEISGMRVVVKPHINKPDQPTPQTDAPGVFP